MAMIPVESVEFYTFWMWRGRDESLREKKDCLPGGGPIVGANVFVGDEGTGVPTAVRGFSAYGYESAKQAAWVALRAALRTGNELAKAGRFVRAEPHAEWVHRSSLRCVHVVNIAYANDGVERREIVKVRDAVTDNEDRVPIPLDDLYAGWCPLDQFTKGAPVEPTTEMGGEG